jgi:hypothetical protein
MIELVKREMDDISYRSVTPIRPIDYHPSSVIRIRRRVVHLSLVLQRGRP